MPVDSSIAMGIKPADIPNPLDVASKAMSLANLSSMTQEHAIELAQKRREFEDDTALRNAYAKNTTMGPGGMPMVDSQGVTQDLVQQGKGKLAVSVDLQNQKQRIEKLQQHQEMGEQLHAIPMNSQEDYDRVANQAVTFGFPDPRKTLGTSFDPDPASPFQKGLTQMKIQNMTAKNQFATQAKLVDQQIAQHGQVLKLKELESTNRRFLEGKQQEANQAYATGKEGVRQRPDIKLNLTDELQFKKAQEAIAPYLKGVDMNDPAAMAKALDAVPLPRQRLFFTELTKMSKGGVAGEGETEENIPNGGWQRYATTVQSLKGTPQAGRAGEFIRQGLEYATGLHNIAFDAITKANNENLDLHAMYMHPVQVERAKQNDAKRMVEEESDKRAKESSSAKTDSVHDTMLDKAKEILADPKASPEMKAKAARVAEVAKRNKTQEARK